MNILCVYEMTIIYDIIKINRFEQGEYRREYIAKCKKLIQSISWSIDKSKYECTRKVYEYFDNKDSWYFF